MNAPRSLPDKQRAEAQQLINKMGHGDGLDEAEHHRLMQLLREAGWENSPGEVSVIDGHGGDLDDDIMDDDEEESSDEEDEDAPMGLDAQGIWHGSKPPSQTGWTQIEPGPRKGMRWKQTGTKPAPAPPSPSQLQPTNRAMPPKPDAAGYSEPQPTRREAPPQMPMPPLPAESQPQQTLNQPLRPLPAATVPGPANQAAPQQQQPQPTTPESEEEIPEAPMYHLQGEELLNHMKTADMTVLRPLSAQSKGANGSYISQIGDVKVLWKPADEESTDKAVVRPGIEPGTYYKREAAAYNVAQAIGLDHLVPPTVQRTTGEKAGSAMQWVNDAMSAYKVSDDRTFDSPESRRLGAAFDFLIGNTDRHYGNWMIGADNRMVLIDHGFSFPTDDLSDFRSDLFKQSQRVDDIVPKEVLQWDSNKIANAMHKNGLEEEAIDGALTRLRSLKEAARGSRRFGEVFRIHRSPSSTEE